MIRKNTTTNCGQMSGTTRKSHTTITRHQEDELSKATSSLFPINMIKMIAKLEWTQSNAQQNIEQLQNHTMNQQQQNHRLRTDSSLRHSGGGWLKCILLVPHLRPRLQNIIKNKNQLIKFVRISGSLKSDFYI